MGLSGCLSGANCRRRGWGTNLERRVDSFRREGGLSNNRDPRSECSISAEYDAPDLDGRPRIKYPAQRPSGGD